MGIFRFLVSVVLVFSLAGCSGGLFRGGGLGSLFQGRLFGADDGAPPSLAPYGGYGEATDPRPLAATLSNVRIERQATGILIRAEAGIPATGYRGITLVEPRAVTPGVLVLEARLQGRGGPAGATVPVAKFVPNARLAGVGQIVLISAGGQISLTR